MTVKGRQICFTVILVILIILFVGGGFYLLRHPLSFSESETVHVGNLSATYQPYKPVEQPTTMEPTVQPAAIEPTESGSTPAPTSLPIIGVRIMDAAAGKPAFRKLITVDGIAADCEAARKGSPAIGISETAAVSAEPIIRFYTTKRATVFTFSGLGNRTEVKAVLDVLRKTGSTATFFVTEDELETQGDLIRLILSGGNSIGISMPPNAYDTVEKMQEALVRLRDILTDDYGCTYQIFVRPTYGSNLELLMNAASACDLQVMMQFKEAVTDKVTRADNLSEVLDVIINPNEGKYQRGEIIHFQMDFFQHSDYLLSQLVENLIVLQCVYPVMAADEVAADTDRLYTYPLPDSAILQEVRDRIYPGHLDGYTNEQIIEIISKGYVGIKWVNSTHVLPGFAVPEIRKLDKKGLIENDQNYVFLTFDNWGTDETVDRLLEVLRKHNVKATFFVRTEYVPNNPNLLRAIAEDGHTIANHTHRQVPLSNEVRATHYEELTPEQRLTLQDDLVTSYETLQRIVGDLRDGDGRPSLSTLFRPPTFAVSKSGLTTVFDCGFTHSISGYCSTGDYKADSAEKLARLIKRNLKSGAVIIMHFSDTAQYTADALDLCLTELEARKVQYRFVGLNAVY